MLVRGLFERKPERDQFAELDVGGLESGLTEGVCRHQAVTQQPADGRNAVEARQRVIEESLRRGGRAWTSSIGDNLHYMDELSSTVGPFGMTRDELIELVREAMDPEPAADDHAADAIMQRICDAVSDPQISDYMWWSPTSLTPEQIVDKALSYRPLAF